MTCAHLCLGGWFGLYFENSLPHRVAMIHQIYKMNELGFQSIVKTSLARS
jgi:hypothetical protein